MLRTILLVGLVAYAAAECPNACSGHGTCGSYDQCTCYKNYQGNDCSERTCPFALAHVDTPKGDLDASSGALKAPGDSSMNTMISGSIVYPTGTTEQFPFVTSANAGHHYMECANKGICNRKTGECECFEGYEGTGCSRASCPNECSGHGTCESIQELAESGEYDTTSHHVNTNTWTSYDGMMYELWDKDVTMGCKCDPQYFGSDCSLRKCKYGVDPLFLNEGIPTYETILVQLKHGAAGTTAYSGNFKLKFYDVFGEDYITTSITGTHGTTACSHLTDALKALPNGVISDLNCVAASGHTNLKMDQFTLEFTKNPGNLKTLEFDPQGFDDLSTDAKDLYAIGSLKRGEFFTYYGLRSDGKVSASAATYDSQTVTVDNGPIGAASGASAAEGDIPIVDATDYPVRLLKTYGFSASATSSVEFACKTLPQGGANGASQLCTLYENHNLRAADVTKIGSLTDHVWSSSETTQVSVDAIAEWDLGARYLRAYTQAASASLLNTKCYEQFCVGRQFFYHNNRYFVSKITQYELLDAHNSIGAGSNGLANYKAYITVYVDKPFGGIVDSTSASAAAGLNLYTSQADLAVSAQAAGVSKNTPVLLNVYRKDSVYYGTSTKNHGNFRAATNTFEYVTQCSNRGVCDHGSGICKCFKGYSSDNCDTQNMLAA